MRSFAFASLVAIASAAANSTLVETVLHTTTATITSCDEQQQCVTSEVPETVTVTNTHHTIATITSCEDEKCEETEVPGEKSTVTGTVDGIETIYTTICPIETAPQPTEQATVTVTCTDYVCIEEKPKPTEAPEDCVFVYICNGAACVVPESTLPTQAPETVVETPIITKTLGDEVVTVTLPAPAPTSEIPAEGPKETTLTVCPPEGCNPVLNGTTPSQPPAQVPIYEGSANTAKAGVALIAVAALALL